ncbi:MAG: hypothetical protein E6Q98_01055 [Rhodospirillaceae bacterium]|nr:MAG: hypothetical protein E6Q98_01055 [Rhodospirillaceae bacterium]
MEDRRPKFLPSYLALLHREAQTSGWRSIIPYGFGVTLLIGFGAAWLIPAVFWGQTNWGVSVAVYTGILTLNGLILALGWTAFGRIYDILFKKEFVAFLTKHDQLNPYLVHINFMHFVQIAAVLVSGGGLLLALFDDVHVTGQRVAFAFVISITIYAIKQAVDAVSAMNDLIWQAAYFENITAQKDAPKSNVVTAFGDRS